MKLYMLLMVFSFNTIYLSISCAIQYASKHVSQTSNEEHEPGCVLNWLTESSL